MKVKSQWTYKFDMKSQFKSDLPNMAIPFEFYTLRDLQDKYTRGTIDSVMMKGHYDDDNSPLDAPMTPERLHLTDPVDVQNQNENISEYIEKVSEEVKSKLSKATKQNATTTTNDDDAKTEASSPNQDPSIDNPTK